MTTSLALIPAQAQLSAMMTLAGELVKSGLLPGHIKTAPAAFAVIQKGLELRIPPMHALSSIHVIDGKPTCSAGLMAALIYREHGDSALSIIDSTHAACTIAYKRRGWAEPLRHTYTIDMAQVAGLVGKPVWKSYPAAMLRARCISAVATMAFPDVVAGMYTPEELGAEVTVDADGDVRPVAMGALALTDAPAIAVEEPPAPPALSPTPIPYQTGDPRPTEAQKRAFRDAFDRATWTKEDIMKAMSDLWGKTRSAELTGFQMDELTGLLTGRLSLDYDALGNARVLLTEVLTF